MGMEELAEQLAALETGQSICLSEDEFSAVFPPGRPDAASQNAALSFAEANGCDIAAGTEVCFVRREARR